jgi:N utilization substance protein B
MSRRASRDIAMKLLYQLEIQKDNREEQIEASLNENLIDENDRAYAADVVYGVFDNTEYIDSIISNQLKGWKIFQFYSLYNLALLLFFQFQADCYHYLYALQQV